MTKNERIAALEAQMTKLLTEMAILQTRVAMLERPPAVSPYVPYPFDHRWRPAEVTCGVSQ
jgi:hypothetical protein